MSAWEGFVDWVTCKPPKELSRMYDDQLSKLGAWQEYDRRITELVVEAWASAPADRYRIRQLPEGMWFIESWTPNPYEGPDYRGLWFDPPEPKIYPQWIELNEARFKSKREAEVWLRRFLKPHEVTFGYDDAAEPVPLSVAVEEERA